jgi:hypothetical protein
MGIRCLVAHLSPPDESGRTAGDQDYATTAIIQMLLEQSTRPIHHVHPRQVVSLPPLALQMVPGSQWQ